MSMDLCDRLSPSEIENIKLAAQGLKYKEVAKQRNVSVSTVKSQMMSARKKAQMLTTDQLIDLALKEGIVNDRCIMLNK